MQIGRIEGTTRVLGKSQGYMDLLVRDDVRASGTPCMTSAWLPTPVELAALNSGAAVHVILLGSKHPPILVEVGPMPGDLSDGK